MYIKLIIDTIMAGLTMEVKNNVQMVDDEIYVWLDNRKVKISAKKYLK